jgi:outer membrane protein OmpA-like peptidoglycan-associated protein
MKARYCLLLTAALLGQLHAQAPAAPQDLTVATGETETTETTVTGAPGTVTRTVVEETVTSGPRRLDPAMARRQLSIVPRALPAEPAVAVPPGAKVETTEIKTIVKQPGLPPRVYNVERSVVIIEGRELPYITLPVLFVKETADLLDSDSRMAIQETAAAILEIIKITPGALFDVEGHTSTDGENEMNLELSAQRARRVYDELVKNYAVPPTVLAAHGHGENYPAYPAYPAGTEGQMMLDRRVLVVRIK